MKLQNILLIFALVLIVSCSDDDEGSDEVFIRDVEEVKAENAEQIQSFLETHFYRFENNPQNPNFQKIVIDTIAGSNQNEEPIINSEFLESKQVTQSDVDYTLYYLKFREGSETVRQTKFSDSALVTYNGFSLLSKEVFDGSPNPIWFDLTNNIIGFYELMTELRGSTGVTENSDGTVTFDDNFGIGTVFIPSGLAYFASPPTNSGIAPYSPIVFNVQLYKSVESDHDRDGVPTWREDVNGNRRVSDDDTDENRVPNYVDSDDDGDGVLTRDEINLDDNGNLILPFPDSNENGTPDYLDPTFPE
jgi:FKBP-type peptidyl-prolyl cis-trans isomerase